MSAEGVGDGAWVLVPKNI